MSLGSGTDVEDGAPVPAIAILHENYPNPFQTSTTINYELSREGHVKVTVFDLQGRKVRDLMDGYQQAGQHTVTLEADNLPSGTYIYQLETREWKTSSKMLLVR